jgi:hypothetical protein
MTGHDYRHPPWRAVRPALAALQPDRAVLTLQRSIARGLSHPFSDKLDWAPFAPNIHFSVEDRAKALNLLLTDR